MEEDEDSRIELTVSELSLDIQSDYLHVHYSGGHPDPPIISKNP
jgi:hypothetical protein